MTPVCTFCILHFFPDTEQARCHEDYPTPWTSPSTCGWFPDVPELGHFQSWLWLVVSEGTLCDPLRDKGVAHAVRGPEQKTCPGDQASLSHQREPRGPGQVGALGLLLPLTRPSPAAPPPARCVVSVPTCPVSSGHTHRLFCYPCPGSR